MVYSTHACKADAHICWLLLRLCMLIYHNDRLQNETKYKVTFLDHIKTARKTGDLLKRSFRKLLNPVTGCLDMCRM